MRSPLAMLTAAALLLGGCTYDFSNPAEELDAGEVTGRIVADLANDGTLSGLADVTVRLRNSSADPSAVWTTKENGRFILLDVMPGRHTILFQKGTNWAITRDVEVGWGSDGQPEGIVIGDIQIRYPSSVGGRFSVARAFPDAFVADTMFAPLVLPPAPNASIVAYDEVTGISGTVTPVLGPGGFYYDFDYRFDNLPVGPHRLRFVAVGNGYGPTGAYGIQTYGFTVVKEVPVEQAGLSLPMNPVTLSQPPPGTGKLRFSVTTPAAFSATHTYAVTLTPANTNDSIVTPLVNASGLFEEDLNPGIWYVDVRSSPGDGTFADPPQLVGVVATSQTTELGTVYFTDPAVVAKSDSACFEPSDCEAPFTCQSGTCAFGEPGTQPPACIVSPDADVCTSSYNGCLALPPGQAPFLCQNAAGACAFAAQLGSFVCVPTGFPACLRGAEYVPAPVCVP